MLIKLGEASEISLESLDSCTPLVSQEMLDKFKKTANALKRVAPKASDFLYFTATMLHAAEASAVNDDGTIKLNSKGEEVKVGWNKSGGTWRWETNDPSIKPYKNSNGDIFPEEELVKAYKKWQYKPLCIDHKSSSVDHVRGFIVDTYYDRKLKRVIGLCALDKAGFPQLARQVETGVSNSVSMGTAVGRAICSDCATVAKTEADFCDHMRKKTCYGEINVDLNPIELSIVVNGADPKANIKHIFAAANAMNNYLEEKNKELTKLAKNYYQANIQFNTESSDTNDLNTISTIQVSSNELDSFKKDVANAIENFSKLQNELKNSEDTDNYANDQVSNEEDNSELALSPPHERYASTDLDKLHLVISSINNQIQQMSEKLSKLEKTANKQEEKMSGSKEMNKNAYMQGTEEPAAPGQKQYPVDPLNEKLRNDGDRQMSADGDMGPVDGMFPGDLERKKMLARAELEERSLKRAAIVNLAKEALDKKSYFQNGEGPNNPNTPTPGKQKYTPEKTQEQLRNTGDKHMVGKKPFPNVGPVDGTYPGDLEVKKKLSRAEGVINASFIKAKNNDGTVNLGKSAWQVFNGEQLLLTASVSDLTGGRNDLVSYNSVANAEFGKKVIENVKSFGADGFKQIMKQAQDASMAPPAPPPPPAPAMPEEASSEKTVEDSGNDGDPKQVALELSEKVKTLSSDLHEAVRELTGEQAEMGNVGGDMTATASFDKSRKELNALLCTAMTEAVDELDGHAQELEMIVNMYDKGAGANSDLMASVVSDAIMEANASVNGGFELMKAFICYADGTEAMLKKAEIVSDLNALAADEKEEESMDEMHGDDDLMSLLNETDSELDDVKEMHDLLDDEASDLDSDSDDLTDEESASLSDEMDLLADDSDSDSDDSDELDANATVKQEELKDVKLPPNSTVTVVAGFDSKASRAALRAKLAADSLKVSPLLHEAHPKGGFTTELDVKPTGDLAKVEDLEEVHEKMLDIATAPVKVRKEAEAIDQLVKAGSLDPADFDALIAEGLDKDAVAYWKKFYGEMEGGSEFASELVKEHVKAEVEAEINLYKVKLARAYELVYEMVDRGLCANTVTAKSEQVDAVMKCNDESFETLKKVVAKHAPLMSKQAGRMPNVGINSEDYLSKPKNEYDMLSELFANSKRKGSF